MRIITTLSMAIILCGVSDALSQAARNAEIRITKKAQSFESSQNSSAKPSRKTKRSKIAKPVSAVLYNGKRIRLKGTLNGTEFQIIVDEDDISVDSNKNVKVRATIIKSDEEIAEFIQSLSGSNYFSSQFLDDNWCILNGEIKSQNVKYRDYTPDSITPSGFYAEKVAHDGLTISFEIIEQGHKLSFKPIYIDTQTL